MSNRYRCYPESEKEVKNSSSRTSDSDCLSFRVWASAWTSDPEISDETESATRPSLIGVQRRSPDITERSPLSRFSNPFHASRSVAPSAYADAVWKWSTLCPDQIRSCRLRWFPPKITAYRSAKSFRVWLCIALCGSNPAVFIDHYFVWDSRPLKLLACEAHDLGNS